MRSVNPYDMIHCLYSLYHIIWYTVTSLPELITLIHPDEDVELIPELTYWSFPHEFAMGLLPGSTWSFRGIGQVQ